MFVDLPVKNFELPVGMKQIQVYCAFQWIHHERLHAKMSLN